MFSTLSDRNHRFSNVDVFSSVNSFNLDQFKILSFGKELTLCNKILDWSKFESFADDKTNVIKNLKKKKVVTSILSFFPTVFLKVFL